MIYQIKQTDAVSPLFTDWQETLIWSCLQSVMGRVFADSSENPSAAMAILGDFCFFAGKPNMELVKYNPRDFMIMVPQNEEWARLIENCYRDKAKSVTRYATKKEPEAFERERLQRAVDNLPNGYELKMIEEDLFYKCREKSWCRDFVSQYADYEKYKKHGLGAVILKDDEIVSGASSYSSYIGGIEIEVDTKEEYRRRGLAYICAAKLILECLSHNLYPSWDAQNKWSLSLAEKLGYHFDHEYPAYEVLEKDI